MLCSSTSEDCSFNSTEALKYVSQKIRSCSRTSMHRYQFAATDAFIESAELPYIPKDSFMASAQPVFRACIDDIAKSISTLIAVVGSYPNTNDIVVFCSNDTNVGDVICSINAVRPKSSWGVTYTVQSNRVSNNVVHTITFGDRLNTATVSDSVLQDVLQQILNKSETMSWYLPGSSLTYSAPTRGIPGHMWVNASDRRTERGAITRSACSRMLPEFYSDGCIESLISVNFGPEDYLVESNPINIQARVNTVREYVLNATTKQKKCYYCSYLSSIHDQVCSGVQNKDKQMYNFTFADGIIDSN